MFILSFETAHHISVMNDFFFQKKNLSQSTFLTISHNQVFIIPFLNTMKSTISHRIQNTKQTKNTKKKD